MRSELYISFVREVVVVEYPSGEERIIMHCLSRHCLASSIVPPLAGGDDAAAEAAAAVVMVLGFGLWSIPSRQLDASRFLLPISSRQIIIDESISSRFLPANLTRVDFYCRFRRRPSPTTISTISTIRTNAANAFIQFNCEPVAVAVVSF